MSNKSIKEALKAHQTGQVAFVDQPVAIRLRTQEVYKPTQFATEYKTELRVDVRWFAIERGFNLGQDNAQNLILRQIYGDLHNQLDLLRRELYACNMNKALARCDEIQNNFGL